MRYVKRFPLTVFFRSPFLTPSMDAFEGVFLSRRFLFFIFHGGCYVIFFWNKFKHADDYMKR